MKTLSFIIVSFCLIYVAKAETNKTSELDRILETIEQINKSDFPYHNQCEGLCFFGSLFSSGASDQLLQQCMVDICGPPEKNPNVMLSNTTFSEFVDPAILTQFDEKIAPVLRINLARQSDHYKKILDDLEGLKGALNKDPAHPEWSAIAHEIMLRHSLISISKKGTPIRVADKRHRLDPEMESFVSSYLQRENVFREETAGKLRNLPIDQLREFLRNQTQIILKELSNKDPLHLTPQDDLKLTFLESSHKVLDSSDRLAIAEMAINISATEKMKNTSCQDEVCRQIIRQEMDLFKKQMAEKVKETEGEQEIHRCRSNFIERTEAVKHTRTFRDHFPKYKQKIIQTGLSSFSMKSRQQFENYMDNTLQIDMFNTDTEKEFRDYMPISKSHSQTGETLSFNDLKQTALNPKYNYICPPAQFTDSIDMFDRTQNKISLSWTSCALHDHGKGILAHEIGHAISLLFHSKNKEKMSKFSANEYQKLRDCASKRYKKQSLNPELIPEMESYYAHPNDKLKTEEDTADLFSYMVFQEDPTHYECLLLQANKDSSKYKGLEILNKSQLDPHSTPFLRVLMEAVHKRTKLSSACRKVIRKYKSKINFKPCF